MVAKDPYAILGAQRGAPLSEIKRAYRKLASAPIPHIGDNPDADIVAAHRSGIFSVLILTGVADAATAHALAGERKPDVVAVDHAELGRLFEQWLS